MPFIWLVLLLIFSSGVQAQSFVNIFETLQEKKKIIYGLDNRRTHIHDHNTVIYGLYAGIGYGKKLRFKLGVSGTPFEVGKFVDSRGFLKRNRLLFATIGEEYDFFYYKKFGMTTYLQAGIGTNNYRKTDKAGNESGKGRELIIPLESGLNFSYELLPYLKLKTGLGWRFVAPEISRELSGYYLKLGLSFDLRTYQQLHKKKT